MFKRLKDKALRAALPLLAGSAVGRMVINKGIATISKKTGLPIKNEYDKKTETWLVTVGDPSAPVQAHLHLTNDALSSLLEEIVPDLVQNNPIPKERIFELLRHYLCPMQTEKQEC